jgi:glutamate--cysteine ligase
MLELVETPDATPSARMLAELQRTGSSFFEFVLSIAREHREYFASITPLNDDRRRGYETEARESIDRQRAIENADDISLDEYLEHYFSAD